MDTLYKRLFKQIEASAAPTIKEWTKIVSVVPQYKNILEQQSQDYSIDYGIYNEPGVPHNDGRVKSCMEYGHNPGVSVTD